MVERRTPNREVLGLIPTRALCCVLEQDKTEELLTGTLNLKTNKQNGK